MSQARKCICGCKRMFQGRPDRKYYNAACRNRGAQRRFRKVQREFIQQERELLKGVKVEMRKLGAKLGG